MLATYPSRSGSLSASYKGKQLHSSFNPNREAERFIESELPSIPRTVIAIGPGLGYLIGAILRKRPDCRIIAMFLSAECHRDAIERGARPWHPDSGITPGQFLDSAISEIEGASLTVIEWPPTASCFAEQANQVRRAVADIVHQHHASLLTEGANGRRWLSNLIRNFLSLRNPVKPQPAGGGGIAACIIAAAGPSLEDALDVVEKIRPGLSLWVVGSALEAVRARGMDPDLVISTDPAVFATEYLRTAVTDPHRRYPIASPLTASRGIADLASTWPLDQCDPVEKMLYESIQPPPTGVPAHGTVTGTALHLALSLQPWPVIVAGMDFAWRDMMSHARPHVAEVYASVGSSRLDPRLSTTYRRARGMTHISGAWRTSPALQVYSRWFERAAGNMKDRVYRILPSPASPSVPIITPTELESLPRTHHRIEFAPVEWPSGAKRQSISDAALRACRSSLGSLAEHPGETGPDELQSFLLRRLALDYLIRWHRSGDAAELSAAAQQARETLLAIGGTAG